jgi:hypothetical protein
MSVTEEMKVGAAMPSVLGRAEGEPDDASPALGGSTIWRRRSITPSSG